MADETFLTVILGFDEPILEFPDEAFAVSVPLSPVGDGLYRVDGIPWSSESARFGDIIEAEPRDDGRLRFLRVAAPGGWRTFDFIPPSYKIESEWALCLLAELEARGVHIECLLGGWWIICLPPGCDLDPAPWLETL